MRHFRGLLLTLMAAGTMASSTAFAAVTTLSPAQIKATFGTGVPFQSSSPSGTNFTITLKPDGTAVRVQLPGKAQSKGTWHVNTTGYCSKWGSSTENCYTIHQDGTKYPVLDAKNKTVATWLAPGATPAATPAPAPVKKP